MDSLTQIVLGASVAEYIGGKKVGYQAPLRGAILGTVPDLDIFINQFVYSNPIQAELAHRGISHSLFFSIMVAPLFGFLLAKLYQDKNKEQSSIVDKKAWKLRTILAFFSIATHRALDLFTGYGTQILQPFSNYAFAIDSVFIIDPLYTVPFMILLIVALCYKHTNPKRKYIVARGIGISTLYLIRSLGVKRWIHEAFHDALEQQEIDVNKLHTSPELFTTFLRRGWAEDEDNWYLGRKGIFDTNTSTTRRIVPKNTQLLEKYRDDSLVQQIMKRRNYAIIVRPGTRENQIIIYPIQFGSSFGWEEHKDEQFMIGYILTKTPKGIIIQQSRWGAGLPTHWGTLRRDRVIGLKR